MHPLAIAFHYPYSPSETFVRQHVELLAPGRTVAVCFNELAPGEFVDQALVKTRASTKWPLRKISGIESKLRTGSRLGASADSIRACESALRRSGCRHLFMEYGHQALAIWRAGEAAGCRLSVQFHGFDMSSLIRLPGILSEYQLLFRSLSSVVVGSRYLAQRAIEIGCPENLIRIVPYGINLERFQPPALRTGRSRRLIAVGRLTEKKAPHLTIEAFNKISRTFPDATLDMIGDGPLKERCEEAILHRKLTDRVILHGAQTPEYIAHMLRSSDVFVQHSITAPDGDVESFGISLVEAMAMGLPTVVTDHNGFPDTIVDGETGFLVPEFDVTGMAERMAHLLDDTRLRRSMGEAGLEWARRNFDLQKTIPELRAAIGYGV